MPISFATGTFSLFRVSTAAAIHESFGPSIASQQHPLSSPWGTFRHWRICTPDRSSVLHPENGLDREEACSAPSALPAPDDSLFSVGGLDHPELERAAASRPDSGLGARGVGRHWAPTTATAVGESETGPISPPRRSFPRAFRGTSQRPGVRVVSVFSRTLGRVGGRGGPLPRGLNL